MPNDLEQGIATESTENVETKGTAEAAPTESASKEDAKVADTTTQVSGEASGEKPEAAAAAAPFTPSLKYKVREEEHEMDEWVKPLVKDAETEKKFQDIYTQKHGLKIAKQERDQYKQELSGLKDSLNYVNDLVKSGDARGFIKALGLDPKMFLNYAIEELRYEQMTPEQKQQVDAQRNQQLTMQTLQMQNQQLATQAQQAQAQQRSWELDTKLQAPDIQTTVQTYDARVGKPGAFRNLVIERGVYHAQVTGTDIPVQQAVNEVLQILGGAIPAGAGSQPQTGQMGTSPAGHVQSTQAAKPVIPNIQGQGTVSPAKKVFTSIADLRNKYQEISAQR